MKLATLAGIVAVGIAGQFGGWEWALLCLIVLAALWRIESGLVPVIATVGCSFVWLALYYWTGDRRLFFPYSMQLAAQLACLLQGRVRLPAIVGGGSIVAVFTMIRIAQSATTGVLIVELAVAAAALAIALHAYRGSSRNTTARVVASALGSVLAFGGLAF